MVKAHVRLDPSLTRQILAVQRNWTNRSIASLANDAIRFGLPHLLNTLNVENAKPKTKGK